MWHIDPTYFRIVAAPVQQVFQLAILRAIKQGLPLDHVVLTRGVAGADKRDVDRALKLLIGGGQLRYEPRGQAARWSSADRARRERLSHGSR